MVVETVQEVLKKKDLPAASELHLGILHEGVCAQVMHIGPYSEEGHTIEMLHEFIENKGYHRSGKHHEIYLGNPRRTAPEKLRTVLRQPIR
ncbi:MAG: GyrI-like domain-containing protein [Candidatus Thorarchaeota archaeon]